jgi:hypothetical protein
MEERDFLHEICLTALSASKAIKFAAVIDNNAKLIVSQYRKNIQTTSRPNYRLGDYCLLSYLFYLDHLMPIITKRGERRRSGLEEGHYPGKHEKAECIHFDLTEINDNVKIATTPLTKSEDKYLCVYLDSSEPHEEIIVTLSNSI